MGYRFFDQYSILHFSVGVITYFWNISFIVAALVHFIFEILENTTTGVYMINKYIIEPGYFSWPGGKHKPDSLMNVIGDNSFFILGYLIAYYLDFIGTKQKWYFS